MEPLLFPLPGFIVGSNINSFLHQTQQEGRNRAKLQELQKAKEELQTKIDKLYAEYEDLMQYL